MLSLIHRSITELPEREAFFIQGRSHTYADLGRKVAAVRRALGGSPGEQNIGIVAHDDLETYASVLGVWFAGKTMVPLNPASPPDRNGSMLDQAGVHVLLASQPGFAGLGGRADTRFIETANLEAPPGPPEPPADRKDEDLAYILFTSGSTGVPKGVPIGHGALRAFLDAFHALGHEVGPADRVLQMFDLTFDLSLMSYCVPLSVGASVVTVPPTGIKYMEIYRLLEEQEITVALLVPSILAHLRPYLDEIELPRMRASLFCGEALHDDLVSAWSRCVPSARVQNVYGPTEATIFCLAFECRRGGPSKSQNGIVSVGRPMKHTGVLIVDEDQRPVTRGQKGELCLSGAQLTPGYWNNPGKNREAFFEHGGVVHYRTGDLCFEDEAGDVMYAGRLDHQIKIQGYRVELSEIEHHVREISGAGQVAAVACPDAAGNLIIHLFIAAPGIDVERTLARLAEKVPPYMIPSRTVVLEALPQNANGKIDRPALVTMGVAGPQTRFMK